MSPGPRAQRELRIIGGALRGRRWRFPADVQIRPTPDRVRETLFNWLAPHLQGARVLDLYAGSGALGLEALSRGASHAVLVDESAVAMAALRTVTETWPVPQAQLVRDDALRFLARAVQPFDIVFLDPPFDAGLLQRSVDALAGARLPVSGGFVYAEQPRRDPLVRLPPGWREHRSGRAGEVGYHLYEVDPQPS